MKQKFEIGQKVKFIGDSDFDAGVIVGFSFDGSEFTYKVSSKEVDHEKKEIIEGIKIGKQEELIAVKEKK